MGKGEVKAPEPTAEERALQAQQTKLLEQQTNLLAESMKQQQLLAPIVFKEAGIIPTIDEKTGEITGFNVDPKQQALQDRKDQIEQLSLDRLEQAFKGDLPVPENLKKEFSNQETQIKETLRRSLGPGWETSSAGIEAWNRFLESKNSTIDAYRRGELQLADVMASNRAQAADIEQSNFLQNAVQNVSLPQGLAQLYGANAQGYGSAVQNYQRNRQLQLTANLNSKDFFYDFVAPTLVATAGAGGSGAASALFA